MIPRASERERERSIRKLSYLVSNEMRNISLGKQSVLFIYLYRDCAFDIRADEVTWWNEYASRECVHIGHIHTLL